MKQEDPPPKEKEKYFDLMLMLFWCDDDLNFRTTIKIFSQYCLIILFFLVWFLVEIIEVFHLSISFSYPHITLLLKSLPKNTQLNFFILFKDEWWKFYATKNL